MKKATSAASSKGQRPITSFFTQPQSKPKKSDEPKALEPTQQHSLDDVEIVQVEPPNKRQRSSPSDQAPATAPATAKPQRPASAPAVDIAARHARWQSKLLGDEDAGMGRVRTWDAVQQRPDKPKPTPLEQQVADLQRRHPDCVLAIAVGYKYRFYGKDAEIASQVLGFFAYPDRNFLVCGVPTVRIDFHVRRLVAAGHKVGIVRQVETAAIKAAGQNRNQPFERKLTAMYTKATLEAGELGALVKPSAGVDGVDADEEEGAASETLRQDSGAYSNEHRSAYLVCIIEEPVDGTSGSGGTVEAAIVAVETSTGQVLYSQVQDSPMRPELESRLMFAQPSDLLAVEPLSVPTRRLLESYASASAGVRTEHADGAAYRSGGALAALTDAVGRPHSTFDNAQSTALDAVMKLPPLVVRALAHALDYLKPFGLGGILSQSSCFRDFSEVQELTLSPNTLHQLEVLRNSDDGKERGSLLWLMDRTITAAGARLMRRWVSRPLKQVEDINERLDAVEELMAEGEYKEHRVLHEQWNCRMDALA